MRARHGVFLPSLVLVLAACGGGKKDAAATVCELLFDCNCGPIKYVDVDACIMGFNAELDAREADEKAIADANGLVFDQGCFDRRNEVPADLNCSLDGAVLNACDVCQTVHGGQPEGAACVRYGLDDEYNDCASHLRCQGGLCHDPCKTLGIGASCDGETPCAEDLYCDFAGNGTCQPKLGAGGACPGSEVCSEGLLCAGDMTCQPPPDVGQPCVDFTCADGLHCASDMTCQPIPGAGQPCDFFCQEGLACTGGTCVPGPGEGEPCTEFGTCGPDLQCDDSELCTREKGFICFLGEP